MRTIVEICGEIVMLELSWDMIDTGEFTQVRPLGRDKDLLLLLFIVSRAFLPSGGVEPNT